MRLAHGKDLLPTIRVRMPAGLDFCRRSCRRPVTIAPGARALVPTGIAIALPESYEAQVRRVPALRCVMV